ncbi:MAG: hypothetical protein Q9200_001361 [Gallowayella weberi]
MARQWRMDVISLLLGLPVVVAAGGSETYNNLFTNLTPIIALFGEQVSKQFLAQSTTFTECLLFALAPLGILTGIVSAIRIGGYSWLKAIIGRAAESKAVAGRELTSATSSSICELWDGQSVVRVHGSPKVLTVVYLKPEVLDADSSSESEIYPLLHASAASESGAENLADFETAKSREWLRLAPSVATRQSERNRHVQRNRAAEWEQDEDSLLSAERIKPQPRKPIPPIPPNLVLNTTTRPSTRVLAWAVCVALGLQGAVLIFGGFLNYKILATKNEADGFAFPLYGFRYYTGFSGYEYMCMDHNIQFKARNMAFSAVSFQISVIGSTSDLAPA